MPKEQIYKSFYFSHDTNARHDEKILALRSVYKSEGYGFYWIIIEMMCNANAYRLQCDGKYWVNAFADELRCEPEKAKSFITDCVNEFRLFESDGKFFWSNSLLRRMSIKDEKSLKAKQSAKKRWDSNSGKNAIAMRTHTDPNANASKNDAIKKRKENKVLNIAFDVWWNIYDKKEDKKDAEKKWSTLTDEQREKAMIHTPKYVASTPNKKFRKLAATYLNKESWDNDISESETLKTNFSSGRSISAGPTHDERIGNEFLEKEYANEEF